MTIVILLLIIAAPIIEIAVMIDVGNHFGLWPTLAMIVLTALVGTALLRHQGLSVINRAKICLQQNQFPADEVFDGICVLSAGAMLLIPGFITDAIGLLLFLPPFRTFLKLIIGRRMVLRFDADPTNPVGDEENTIIGGEYHEIGPETMILPDDEKTNNNE